MKTDASSPGNTLTEYGLALGLVALLGIGAMQVLGTSTSGTLGGVKNNEDSLLKMANLDFTGDQAPSLYNGNVEIKGNGYLVLTPDPNTGLPVLMMTDSNTGSVKNATSIEGAMWNTLGGVKLGDSLMALAQEQADPAVASHLKLMAEKTYYLGAVEGELDGVQNLERVDSYGNIHALKDLMRLQSELKTLMENPPAGMTPETIMASMPLAADAYNIAQTYHERLSQYLTGNPDDNFSMPSNIESGFGAGRPGLALANSTLAVPQSLSSLGIDPNMQQNIENVFDIPTLKSVANQVLNDNQVSSAPVEATFNDAQQIENWRNRKRGYRSGSNTGT